MTCVSDSSSGSHFKSLDRVHNYPIINDSLEYVFSYYQWIKSSNGILDNTLSRAEKTLKAVKDTAEPIAVRQLGFIDNAVWNQLEKLEKTCPIILESSNSITNIPSKIYHESIESTKKTLMWPVTKTLNTVSKTSNFAISTVSSVVSSSMNIVLPATYLTNVSTNYVLDKTDEFLNKYLPDNSQCSEESYNNADIVTKVKRLSGKTQQRLYKRASEQINSLLKGTLERLHQIQLLIEEINRKREDLHNSVAQEYLNTLDVIKRNNPFNFINPSQVLREAVHYSAFLKNAVSSSTNVTLEYMLNNALNGLDIVNDNLFKLQNFLQQSRPESITGEILIHTSTAVTEIRIALDSFIYHMKQYSKRKFHEEEMTEMQEINASTDESFSDSDG